MSISIDFHELMTNYDVRNDENLKITGWDSSLQCIRIRFYAKIASKDVHIEMINEESYDGHNLD